MKNEYNINSAGNAGIMLEAKADSESDALSVLKSLATGDKVTASVLDIMGNEVTINVNNSAIKAALTGNMPVNIGDTITFEVNNDNEKQIVLKPLISGENSENLFAQKALDAAMLPVTEKNTEIVMQLVKNNMPVNKEALLEYSRLMAANPNASPETLVNLKKLEIPITPENITQFENYKNYEHSISAKIGNISEGFIALSQNSDGLEALKSMINLPETVSGEDIRTYIGEEQINELKNMVSDETIKESITKGITPKELLNALLNSEKPETLVKSEAFKSVVKMFVREQLLINPADVSKDNEIKDFYTRILKQSGQMTEILKQSGQENTPAFKEITNVKDNVSFMNDLNHMLTYVQIPLKFANQNVHSDLYVFKNKGQKIDKDDVSALLHLDMDNLGKMDIYVKLLNGTNVTTNFCLENEEMLDFINEHMDILQNRLKELGYNLNATAKVTGTAHDFVKDFVDEGRIEKEVMRYSFDIRA